MLLNKYLVILPGIILAFVLYTLSQGFNNIIGIELLGYDKSPISTAMIAILLGMFFGNVFSPQAALVPSLDLFLTLFEPLVLPPRGGSPRRFFDNFWGFSPFTL